MPRNCGGNDTPWAEIIAFEEWLDRKLIDAGVDIGIEALKQPGGDTLFEMWQLFSDAYDGLPLEAAR